MTPVLLHTFSQAHWTVVPRLYRILAWKFFQQLQHNLGAYLWVENKAKCPVPWMEICHISSFISHVDSLHLVKNEIFFSPRLSCTDEYMPRNIGPFYTTRWCIQGSFDASFSTLHYHVNSYISSTATLFSHIAFTNILNSLFTCTSVSCRPETSQNLLILQ